MRDRLIELLRKSGDVETWNYNTDDFKKPDPIESLAIYLLANGVIVPPCPIGTKIYMLVTKRAKINFPTFTFVKESKLTFLNLERVIEEFGKTVFLTREEAEAALKGE